jgi:hypothetical protein
VFWIQNGYELYSINGIAMKQIYSLSFSLLLLVIFSSCSKDFLKPYDERIIGSWRITEIDVRGIGGSSRNLAFNEGEFSFLDDGRLVYNRQGRTYQGSWDLRRVNRNDERVQVLQLSAIDFAAQDVRTEYFDDINFTNTNRFRGFIHSGNRTYVVHFIRL